jgi:ABC-type Mn2+/Zn2+ transport system ATPase subunit
VFVSARRRFSTGRHFACTAVNALVSLALTVLAKRLCLKCCSVWKNQTKVWYISNRSESAIFHSAAPCTILPYRSVSLFAELSGGQQQRVIIAKALAGNAEVLILDEPTTGIDERSQADFYALLTDLQARGVTIILVSHEVDTVLSMVSRVLCLNRSLLYDGPPEHFETDTYMPATYTAHHRQLHHQHGCGRQNGDSHA